MKLRDLYRDALQGSELGAFREKARRIFTYESSPFAGSGRRLNRFLIGADPEFLFEQPSASRETRYIHAADIGLKPALAFGSDQNDRLVELRPHPSRSAVEVVASTLAELRWMYRINVSTRDLTWRSGAFAHGDGMGGHVHFGRKRPNRMAEVAALDGLAKTLRRAGLFPTTEWARRSQGDSRGQRYGNYGDIRLQRHGYEYRTLPSWLDSPRLAFLVLTLSKLVVGDPGITGIWDENTTEDAWDLLVGFTKFYKGLDDDAWILYSMMGDRAAFTWQGGDFKARWGIGGPVATEVSTFCYPDCIAPTGEDVSDVMEHFTKGTTIPWRECAANFRTHVPAGYSWLLSTLHTGRQMGVGELTHDLVTHPGMRINWNFTQHESHFQLYHPSNWTGRDELQKLVGDEQYFSFRETSETGSGGHFHFHVGRNWRRGDFLTLARKILKSGLLPVWTMEEVAEDSAAQFASKYLAKGKAKKSKETAFDPMYSDLENTPPSIPSPFVPVPASRSVAASESALTQMVQNARQRFIAGQAIAPDSPAPWSIQFTTHLNPEGAS